MRLLERVLLKATTAGRHPGRKQIPASAGCISPGSRHTVTAEIAFFCPIVESPEVIEVRHSRIAVILGVALLTIVGCSVGSSKDVTVATASHGTISTAAAGLGVVKAGVDVPLAIGFRDQVVNVNVSAGQHVAIGQGLLTLDPQPLVENAAKLRASLQHAQADLAHVRASLAADQLRSAELVPGLRNQAQALQSQVDIYGQLLAMAQGKQSMVTSPIDGEVLAVDVQPGHVVAPGATLIEIVDYSRITVSTELPVSAQPEIQPGTPAQVSFANLPGTTIQGTVSQVSPGAINSGTGFQATIEAANTPDKRVRPGYQASMQVPYSHRAIAVVRKMAVLDIDRDPTVFVVKGDLVERRSVQVGTRDRTDVEITSGLLPGDVYVLVGNQSLDNGDRVHVASSRGAIAGRAG
jgi:RND family efflux transporter MFP subunit